MYLIMKTQLLGIFGIIILVNAASSERGMGANIVASNDSDPHPIVLANGNLVPVGTGFVSIGSFTLSDAQISSAMNSAANLAALRADFIAFGVGVSFGIGTDGGMFSDTFTEVISAGDALEGLPIFVMAGNANDLLTSTELWVFKTNEVFAVDGGDPFSARIELDAEFGAGTELIGDAVSVFLPGAGQSFNGSRMVKLVPEPAAGVLLLLAGMLMVRRHR
jgi:hypothetical protein